MVKRVRQNEQPWHRAIGFGTQLVANQLHTFGGSQIDIDHDARESAGGSVGNIRRRDGVDLARGLQNTGQFAASITAI